MTLSRSHDSPILFGVSLAWQAYAASVERASKLGAAAKKDRYPGP